MSLAQRLRLILLEQKLKQVDFARTVKVSANYINLLVNGKRTRISAALALRIQKAYGYSSHWLLTGVGECHSDFSKEKIETLKKIKKMDDKDVDKVLAFLKELDQGKVLGRVD